MESCRATALLVYVEALTEDARALDLAVPARIFCVTNALPREKESRWGAFQCLRIPNVPMTRMGQVRIAVFLALARALIQPGERVVFLSGLAAARTLDTIIITEVGQEHGIFAKGVDLTPTSSKILPEVVERVVDIASELGSEGREGRAVGAMFVVGDTEHVLPLTRQLLLNPFKGYPPEERSILDHSLEETVKELATLDGAFIVGDDGVMETCGVCIRTTGQPAFDLPRGLGARHYPAAAITGARTPSPSRSVNPPARSRSFAAGGSSRKSPSPAAPAKSPGDGVSAPVDAPSACVHLISHFFSLSSFGVSIHTTIPYLFVSESHTQKNVKKGATRH
ncbi:MAG: diadenylate cyclase [Planctomycetes bacterium]|nr:diadenylate cyclase [Planctomycetota bacterium]